MKKKMYQRIASLLPKGVIDKFREELSYLEIPIEEKRFVGFVFIYSLALSFGIALNLFLFFGIPIIISFVIFSLLFFGGVYIWLSMMSESKGKFVEKILPDALQMIASNIRSGLTTERALLASARPEFGILEKELKRASKKIMAGERIEIALMDMPERIRSKTLERTIWLISKGIRSGGKIADLLMKLSDDLREQNALQQETKANISIYVMLILFSSMAGAPVLFGISTFIVQALYKHMSDIPSFDPSLSEQSSMNIPIAGSLLMGERNPIEPEFAIMFAMVIMFFGSIFAALTIGVINAGKELEGIRYILPILLGSFAIFFVVRFMLSFMFGSLIQ
ncbi:type II secretion system F family protein [Candidatus Micrarchaeota archaeon]|nr:type II secretion system F family protein [Candidatus Micrarchaeota archaeon]